MHKTCTKCNVEKDEDCFPFVSRNDKRYKSSRRKAWCKSCCNAANKAWAESERGKAILASPERKRRAKDAVLRFNYGITVEEFERMETEQEGKCAACKTRSKLFVDHDHETKVVRSLLCHGCNSSLGLLGEDPERIMALAAYAEKC